MSRSCKKVFVKWIEPVSSEEFVENPTYLSIMGVFGANGQSRWDANGNVTYKFIYMDGEVERELPVCAISANEKDRKDGFSFGHSLFPIKMGYSDGRVEYGFQMLMTPTREVVRVNSELTSLYVKDGYVTPNGWLVPASANKYVNNKMSLSMVKMLPFMNEKKNKSKFGHQNVGGVMSWLMPSGLEYSVPKNAKDGIKRAWRVEKDSGSTYTDSSQEDDFSVAFFSYLKSVYLDKTVMRQKSVIFPLGSLMFINKKVLSYRETGDETIWYAIDQHVHGNIF